MPKPPAAFSPFTMTRSSFQSRTRRGSRSATIARPLRPTTSPMNRIRTSSGLPRVAKIDGVALREHEIKGGVAGGAGDGGNLLRRVGDADRGHRLHAPQPRDRHVVIAGA